MGTLIILEGGDGSGKATQTKLLVERLTKEGPVSYTHLDVYKRQGIGFTMSIFVYILTFEPGHAQEMAKGGVILGSLISALFGYIFLRLVGANRKECHIGVYHNC